METWPVRIRDGARRLIGLVLVAQAFAVGEAAIDSISDKQTRQNGLTFTQLFAQRHDGMNEHLSAYEFADGEALNAIAIVGLAGAGIHLMRRRGTEVS
jgi:glycine betaine/choline ABC-type transport system substrate-binding protein